MKLNRLPLISLLVCMMMYLSIIGPFRSYMKQKPVEEKLGYLPTTNVMRYASADHKEMVGALLIMKVIMYFGGIIQNQQSNVITQPPDYQRMSGILHGAVKLDPYNMDAYYFSQAFLTWDAKQYDIANKLLEYGMKYRTWDWMLPFFVGFNSAYFQKDYQKAADYFKRAGELSGSELYRSLAGRYMQQTGQTELAIMYLSALEKGETNQSIKRNYHIRLQAFKEVRRIEVARDRYLALRGSIPVSVVSLVDSGILTPAPVDPYGGSFYFEPDGKVATTSKFTFAGALQQSKKNNGGVE